VQEGKAVHRAKRMRGPATLARLVAKTAYLPLPRVANEVVDEIVLATGAGSFRHHDAVGIQGFCERRHSVEPSLNPDSADLFTTVQFRIVAIEHDPYHRIGGS
jgi:hypothetical protein